MECGILSLSELEHSCRDSPIQQYISEKDHGTNSVQEKKRYALLDGPESFWSPEVSKFSLHTKEGPLGPPGFFERSRVPHSAWNQSENVPIAVWSFARIACSLEQLVTLQRTEFTHSIIQLVAKTHFVHLQCSNVSIMYLMLTQTHCNTQSANSCFPICHFGHPSNVAISLLIFFSLDEKWYFHLPADD